MPTQTGDPNIFSKKEIVSPVEYIKNERFEAPPPPPNWAKLIKENTDVNSQIRRQYLNTLDGVDEKIAFLKQVENLLLEPTIQQGGVVTNELRLQVLDSHIENMKLSNMGSKLLEEKQQQLYSDINSIVNMLQSAISKNSEEVIVDTISKFVEALFEDFSSDKLEEAVKYIGDINKIPNLNDSIKLAINKIISSMNNYNLESDRISFYNNRNNTELNGDEKLKVMMENKFRNFGINFADAMDMASNDTDSIFKFVDCYDNMPKDILLEIESFPMEDRKNILSLAINQIADVNLSTNGGATQESVTKVFNNSISAGLDIIRREKLQEKKASEIN